MTAESPAADVTAAQLPAGRIRVLTLRQPWATAVAELANRTENRTWRLPAGYPWIHAGARSGWDKEGPAHPALRAAWRERHGADTPAGPDGGLITYSAVVALARVTGAHHAAGYTSPGGRPCNAWAAAGQVHNTLELTAVLPRPVHAEPNSPPSTSARALATPHPPALCTFALIDSREYDLHTEALQYDGRG